MTFWRVFFVVAGVFNFLVGLPMLVAPEALLAGMGQPIPDDLLTVRMTAWLITTFGVGYLMVARDTVANRPIVWLGVMGKAPIALFVWLEGGNAVLTTTSFFLSLGDLAFTALFLVFLLTHRRPRAA